jgi:hypothetical protein
LLVPFASRAATYYWFYKKEGLPTEIVSSYFFYDRDEKIRLGFNSDLHLNDVNKTYTFKPQIGMKNRIDFEKYYIRGDWKYISKFDLSKQNNFTHESFSLDAIFSMNSHFYSFKKFSGKTELGFKFSHDSASNLKIPDPFVFQMIEYSLVKTREFESKLSTKARVFAFGQQSKDITLNDRFYTSVDDPAPSLLWCGVKNRFANLDFDFGYLKDWSVSNNDNFALINLGYMFNYIYFGQKIKLGANQTALTYVTINYDLVKYNIGASIYSKNKQVGSVFQGLVYKISEAVELKMRAEIGLKDTICLENAGCDIVFLTRGWKFSVGVDYGNNPFENQEKMWSFNFSISLNGFDDFKDLWFEIDKMKSSKKFDQLFHDKKLDLI